jgi:hypothetical protein
MGKAIPVDAEENAGVAQNGGVEGGNQNSTTENTSVTA